MSVQKLNIRLPERIDLSPMLQSKPLQPIPFPTQINNNNLELKFAQNSFTHQHYIKNSNVYPINPIINNQSVITTRGLMNMQPRQQNNYFSPSSISPNNIVANRNVIHENIRQQQIYQQNQFLPQIRAHFPVQKYTNQPHFIQNQFPNNYPNMSYPINRPQSPNISQHNPLINSNQPARPKSPKVQFKYVSPSKQKKNLSQIKEVAQSRSNMKNSIAEDQMQVKSSLKYNKSQSIGVINQFQQYKMQNIQVAQNSRKKQGDKGNSISNHIYLIQDKGSQQQSDPNHNVNTQRKENLHPMKQKQQPLSFININNENKIKSQLNNIQIQQKSNQIVDQQINKTQKQQSSDQQDKKDKLKYHDDQVKLMLKQYENLKYYNQTGNLLPCVQKNSSDQDQSKDSKKNSILEIKKFNKTVKDSSIKQQNQFTISGVQKVKSQVLVQQNPLSITQKKQKHQKLTQKTQTIKKQQQKQQISQYNQIENQQIHLKLRQKEVQVKNLKNQIWLFKLRQNQLLATIKKLQNINKDQNKIIEKLAKNISN